MKLIQLYGTKLYTIYLYIIYMLLYEHNVRLETLIDVQCVSVAYPQPRSL